MRRVVGIDIHRTFGEVVYWEDGRLRHGGRVDMTRTALEGFGKTLTSTDEVVIEATGNCMAVSRVLSPFVRRVVIANRDCQEFCAGGQFPQLKNRSPKMTANCVFASTHSRGARFHCSAALLRTRYNSFIAASSPGR